MKKELPKPVRMTPQKFRELVIETERYREQWNKWLTKQRAPKYIEPKGYGNGN